jgi:hypothetical protein
MGELNVMGRVAPVDLTDRTIRMWPVGILIAGGLVSQMTWGVFRCGRAAVHLTADRRKVTKRK